MRLSILFAHAPALPVARGRKPRARQCALRASHTRREALVVTVLAGMAAPFATAAAAAAATATERRGEGQQRLAQCRADQNCVSSTSVRNPSKFTPPWSFAPETDDPSSAWRSLQQAVASESGARIVEDDGGTRMRAECSYSAGPLRGVDDVEFQMRPADKVVAVRSCGRDTTYVYPVQAPLGDLGRNRKRLARIRERLGWEELDFKGNI